MRILNEMRQRLARLIWPSGTCVACALQRKPRPLTSRMRASSADNSSLSNWLVVNTWYETNRWPYYRIVEDGLTLIEADDIAQGHEAYKVMAGHPERLVQSVTGALTEI